MSKAIFQELYNAIDQMPVADSHEHLMPEFMRVDKPMDFFTITMTHYASSDLISAGMLWDDMHKLNDINVPLGEKIQIFMPYWKKANNTTYCRALKIAAKDLYGIEEINAATLPELNARMVEQNRPGLYKKIMEDKGKIKYCIWDQWWVDMPQKDDFYPLAVRLDGIIFINSPGDIQALEEKFNTCITGLDKIEEILETCINGYKASGIVAIKSALAYSRSLDYSKVSAREAAVALRRILRNEFTAADTKTLQDYVMFRVAEKAAAHNLVFQIHTGLLEGNGNFIRNANPSLLSTLVYENPNTKFALMHGGYPYGGELSAMAKMFPNVYIDMCWLHIISTHHVYNILMEWLDAVPVNKILGFGGDYIFVEGVYGHLQLAKENLARVLADKVANGSASMAEAEKYARMMLFDNVEDLFFPNGH
ncbi:MAG: amidohydrolase [Firmicutes bacterium]|nr:amidohydrolase [Bacillota bacterium]